jgi:hypothetical protein
VRFISISLFWWTLDIKDPRGPINGSAPFQVQFGLDSWYKIVALYNKLDTTSTYLYFFNVVCMIDISLIVGYVFVH